MPEDSKEILKRIEVDKELPFTHVTRGKTSDQTVEKYYAELDTVTLDRLYKLFLMYDTKISPSHVLYQIFIDKYVGRGRRRRRMGSFDGICWQRKKGVTTSIKMSQVKLDVEICLMSISKV